VFAVLDKQVVETLEVGLSGDIEITILVITAVVAKLTILTIDDIDPKPRCR